MGLIQVDLTLILERNEKVSRFSFFFLHSLLNEKTSFH